MSDLISTVGLPIGLYGSPSDIIRSCRGKVRDDFPKAQALPRVAQVRTDFPKAAVIPHLVPPMDRLIAHAQSFGRYGEF